MTSPNAGSASSEYTRRIPDVQKVRAFIAGGASVHPWIERLRGHDDEDFNLYQRLAYYLNATSRTLDAMTGMVMNPEPMISDMPDEFQPYIDDLTNDGEPFNRICYRTVEEVTATGRYCLLVDYANDPDAPGITRLEAERRGFRPFVRPYRWEDILDWRMATINGKRMLSHLRLMEYVDEPDPFNEWETKVRKYVRVLDLYSEGGAAPRYRVRIYREAMANNRAETTPGALVEPGMELYGEPFFPLMNGRPMDYIPAVIFGPNSLDPAILDRPPLIEMVECSQSHLNDSALRQWGLMWCGQPVPVITGLMDSEDTAELRLGSSQGLVLGEGGSFQLIALGADGVGAIAESMENKRRDMAAIGARILADESGAQISTETARIQRAGEHSVLAGIANTVADGMTQVLRMLAEWAGISAPDMAVTLNTDFMPRGLQQGELQEWLTQVQLGTLPLATAIEHLKSRGVIDPQMTEQDWRDGIEDAMIDRPETGRGQATAIEAPQGAPEAGAA